MMETQRRGRPPTHQVVPPPKPKKGQERRLRIMIMRSVGGVISFNIHPRILLVAVIFLLIYLPGSIIIINDYFSQRDIYRKQATRLTQLEEETSHAKNTFDNAQKQIAILQDYIVSLESAPESPSEKTASMASNKPVSPAETEETAGPNPVDLKEIMIRQEPDGLTVKFKLTKVTPGETPISGYIHLIAEDADSEPPRRWIYPHEALENGIPSNYRHGLSFRIQRFRPVSVKFELDPYRDTPSTVRVLVYDQLGAQLLEREFKIRKRS
jgi:hypothetical protein